MIVENIMKKASTNLLAFAQILASLLLFNLFHSDGRGAESGYFEKVYPATMHDGEGRLRIPVEWRLWIPEGVNELRGVVVHQHGCGSGSGDGARTAVYDLHWQELARKYDCALIAASYRQGEFPCETWCDPRNGSASSFLAALDYFADYTGRSELRVVPWGLWGHSGGGQWVGCMAHLYPERVVAACLRSGCPDTVVNIFRELPLNDKVTDVPMMLNLGAFEYKIPFVWNSCWDYFREMRGKDAKICLLIDPHTEHEVGNTRYPDIRFLDLIMEKRLPQAGATELGLFPVGVVLPESSISDEEISLFQDNFKEEVLDKSVLFNRRECLTDGIWFPSEEYISHWRKYSLSSEWEDTTPPPAPYDVWIEDSGRLSWKCRADIESGLAGFILYKNGESIYKTEAAPVVNAAPIFQGLMYSDTPDFSLPAMEYAIPNFDGQDGSLFEITSLNTKGLESEKITCQRR